MLKESGLPGIASVNGPWFAYGPGAFGAEGTLGGREGQQWCAEPEDLGCASQREGALHLGMDACLSLSPSCLSPHPSFSRQPVGFAPEISAEGDDGWVKAWRCESPWTGQGCVATIRGSPNHKREGEVVTLGMALNVRLENLNINL